MEAIATAIIGPGTLLGGFGTAVARLQLNGSYFAGGQLNPSFAALAMHQSPLFQETVTLNSGDNTFNIPSNVSFIAVGMPGQTVSIYGNVVSGNTIPAVVKFDSSTSGPTIHPNGWFATSLVSGTNSTLVLSVSAQVVGVFILMW